MTSLFLHVPKPGGGKGLSVQRSTSRAFRVAVAPHAEIWVLRNLGKSAFMMLMTDLWPRLFALH